LLSIDWRLLLFKLPTVIPDRYSRGVIPGRKFSTQIPKREDGNFGTKPAAEPVVVFLLGVRFNHPLGLLAPGVKEIGRHFQNMANDLTKTADEFGMLGVSSWQGTDRPETNTMLTIM